MQRKTGIVQYSISSEGSNIFVSFGSSETFHFASMYEVDQFLYYFRKYAKRGFEPIPVIFRMFRGEVLALFPTLPGTNDPSTMTCYAAIGQHSYASMFLTSEGRLATPEEYAPLLRELTDHVGYNLTIVKRATRKHYEIRQRAINRVEEK
jgi:hypothetical protein